MHEHGMASPIRERLADGRLPVDKPRKTWAGNGTNRLCHGCDQIILRAQIEYEIDMEDRHIFRLHVGCLGLWQAERSRLGHRPAQFN